MLREHLAQMASLIFPATCVGCEEPLSITPKHVEEGFHSNWCDDCWIRLPEPWERGCPKCGSFIKRPEAFGDYCALCRDLKLRFDSTVALGSYHGMLKRMVLDFKRDMDETLTFQLGRLLGLKLRHYEFFDDIDFLVPVPIHWQRRFKRGFHAAGVIAEGIHAVTGKPVENGMLKCERLTEKQGTLSGQKRFRNVKDAFRLKPLVTVADSKIVIVDDVMTSGATLGELAKMLRKSGALAAHCAVVARGTGGHRPD